jgi:hypothetical protein
MEIEMTPDEFAKYGSGRLSIWQQLALLQAWSPLLGYGQRFVQESDPYKRSMIIADACEWLASKTDTPLDNELVSNLIPIFKTEEGERFVRWLLMKAEEIR